jgi:chromosome partitioning protein
MVIICIANNKGGVGKTTTAYNIGFMLALISKKKILFIDNDHQRNLTDCLRNGKNIENKKSIKDIYLYNPEPKEVIIETEYDNIMFIRSDSELNNIDSELKKTKKNPELVLKQWLKLYEDVLINDYGIEYALIDSAPAEGIYNINGFEAADTVMVVIEPNEYALKGLLAFKNRLAAPKKYNKGIILYNMAEKGDELYEKYASIVFNNNFAFYHNVLKSTVSRHNDIKLSINTPYTPIAINVDKKYDLESGNPYHDYLKVINEMKKRKVL